MNKQTRLFTVIFIFLLFTGCSRTADGWTEITVDPESAQATDLSEYPYITLENRDGAPSAGYISHAEITGQGIFLSSMGQALRFNTDGTLYGKIGNKGRAGNEYIGCSSLTLDRGNVIMTDFNGRKIIVYSDDGEFIKSCPMDEASIFWLQPLADGWIARLTYTGGGPEVKAYALASLDKDFHFTGHTGDMTLTSSYNFAGLISQGHDGTVLFWNALRNLIYRVDETGQVGPMYRISFGDFTFPEPENSSDPEYNMLYDYRILQDLTKPEWADTHAGLISHICETADRFFFTYNFKGDTCIAVYDKMKGKVEKNMRLILPAGSSFNTMAFDKNGGAHIFTDTDTATSVYNVKL